MLAALQDRWDVGRPTGARLPGRALGRLVGLGSSQPVQEFHFSRLAQTPGRTSDDELDVQRLYRLGPCFHLAGWRGVRRRLAQSGAKLFCGSGEAVDHRMRSGKDWNLHACLGEDFCFLQGREHSKFSCHMAESVI